MLEIEEAVLAVPLEEHSLLRNGVSSQVKGAKFRHKVYQFGEGFRHKVYQRKISL